jgi:hypothetical protein
MSYDRQGAPNSSGGWGTPTGQEGKTVMDLMATEETSRAFPMAVKVGGPLMKTCGEGKPHMAALMLLLLLLLG